MKGVFSDLTVNGKEKHEQLALWNVPAEWEWVSLEDVGDIITGNTPSTKEESNYGGEIPFVKPPELNDKGIRNASNRLFEKGALSARMLPVDAVLVSCIGGLGKTGIAKVPVAFNQQINAIIFNKNIVPEFGFYYAQMLKPWLYDVASATTLPLVNKGKFKNAPFPLAPIQQQKRIVEEIEKQFSRLDEAVENLQRVKANLKRYKAAVLKAAVEGKLTEEWRKQNPVVEPASKLLERILLERRTKWEEAELAKMKAKGKVPKDEKWKKKYKEPGKPQRCYFFRLGAGAQHRPSLCHESHAEWDRHQWRQVAVDGGRFACRRFGRTVRYHYDQSSLWQKEQHNHHRGRWQKAAGKRDLRA